MSLHAFVFKKKALGFNAKQLVKINLISITLIFIFFVIYVLITYLDLTHNYSFKKIIISQTSVVKDNNGSTLDYIFRKENRVWKNYEQINKNLIDFVITAEDDSFYHHSGIDIKEIKNSIKANFDKKSFKRGASTITQQLVKNLFLNKEKTIIRKLRELSLSLKIEQVFSKRKIIEYYMNVIEWGPGIYGVEAASRYYFDKSNTELNLNQISFLTLIIPNPKRFSPFYRPQTINFINHKNRKFAYRLYNEKNITYEEKQIVEAPFTFNRSRSPKNLDNRYPKIDLYNYKEKNYMFKDLETYLLNKYKNLYYSPYEITLSLNKNRTSELINYLKSIGENTGSSSLYLPVSNDGKIVALVPYKNEETASLLSSILIDNEQILEPVKKIPWGKIILNIQKLRTISLN